MQLERTKTCLCTRLQTCKLSNLKWPLEELQFLAFPRWLHFCARKIAPWDTVEQPVNLVSLQLFWHGNITDINVTYLLFPKMNLCYLGPRRMGQACRMKLIWSHYHCNDCVAQNQACNCTKSQVEVEREFAHCIF